MIKGTSLAVLERLKREAAQAATALQKEIARREAELSSLRAELERWGALVPASPSPRRPRGGERLDWKRVLAELPATFAPRDVGQRTGKPMAQVYAGLSRWAKEKKVRRVRGGYRKVEAGRTAARPAAKKKRAAPARAPRDVTPKEG